MVRFDDDDSDQRDGILFSDYEGDGRIGDWRISLVVLAIALFAVYRPNVSWRMRLGAV